MKINGGATIWARQTIDSDIFCNKPDKWFKIWFYLVNKANHRDDKQLKRGSCFMKYEWIMEKTKATKSEVDHCMRWLKSAKMVATQKATRGFILEVLNYDKFQKLEHYKSDTEKKINSEKIDVEMRRHNLKEIGDKKSDTEISKEVGQKRSSEEGDKRKAIKKAKEKRHRSDTINKNDKNDKINNYIYSLFNYWNSLKITVHKDITKFKPHLRAALQIYSVEKIKEAMRNYNDILKSEEYYWDYRYKLDDFLKRKGNIDRFLSINKPFENFRKDKGGSNKKNKKENELTPHPPAYSQKKFTAQDWELLRQAKMDLEKFANEDKIYKWLCRLPPGLHNHIALHLRKVYPKDSSGNYDRAKRRYELKKNE